MAKARAIVKRRKAVQNIRKITRTMELIATARFKKALDRATEAEAYTRKIAELVADRGSTALEASHPLRAKRGPPPRGWRRGSPAGGPGPGGPPPRSWRGASRSAARSCSS